MTRSAILGGLTAAILLTVPGASAQAPEGYVSGVGPLQYFDHAAIIGSPLWLKIWLGIMVATFAAGLFFVPKHAVARWAVGGFLMPFLVMSSIIDALGWPFLSGSIALAHLLFWTPALVLLLWQRPFSNTNNRMAFRIWSGLMAAVIAFSLFFDVRDAFIYVAHFSA